MEIASHSKQIATKTILPLRWNEGECHIRKNNITFRFHLSDYIYVYIIFFFFVQATTSVDQTGEGAVIFHIDSIAGFRFDSGACQSAEVPHG